MSRPSHPRARARAGRPRRGFTLVELLVVIAVLGILVGLLVPAVMRAMQTGKEAAVAADINLMAASLAAFKDRYGDYPPSRIVLREDGVFDTTDTTVIPGSTTDLTIGELGQRSLRYMRKFFPRVAFSTSASPFGANFNTGAGTFYDFNGNNQADVDSSGNALPYVLEGHECLVFFLGGIPSSSGEGMAGFGKNPANPFVGDSPTGGTSNRNPALFEFAGDRLVDEDGDGIPGYIDSLAVGNPVTGGDGRFFAYFSAYGTNGYDPNDVNFRYNVGSPPIYEQDPSGTPLQRSFLCTFAASDSSGGKSNYVYSPAPNPYTSSAGVPIATARAVTFQNANTYQIISAGNDRLYGFGGRHDAGGTGDRLTFNGESPETPPGGSNPTIIPQDLGIRQREADNLTNFATGRLQ